MGELVPQSPGTPAAQPAGQVLVTIGDMACTQTTVITPTGSYPLAGTTWIVANNTVTTESIPAYAIVMAIIFFIFCLLGLLFLLIKERKTQGYVQVSVQGPGLFHATQVPVSSPAHVLDIEQRVNYCRSLVAALQGAR
jgi:hypothetical protein